MKELWEKSLGDFYPLSSGVRLYIALRSISRVESSVFPVQNTIYQSAEC